MLAETLHQTLDEAAAKAPDTAATFASESASITLADLAATSLDLAAGLMSAGVRPGDRVGVLCPNEPYFLQALFAITRTGAAACPLPLPVTMNDLAGYVARLARISAAAGVRRIVVTGQYAELIDALDPMLPDVTLLRPADLTGVGGLRHQMPEVSPEALAIVQFTSGSTAVPKGVQLSHRNVLSCLDAIVDGIEMGQPGDAGGIWLPLYHDMGLFGALSALLIGVPVTMWSPTSFVKNPARWLRTFADVGATICPCPNFGYDYLVAAVGPEEAASFDLSRWRIAFNGAETIAVESIETFLERFAPAGFRPEVMFPVYGLAEATLAVTFPPLGRTPVYDFVDATKLAGDGEALPTGRGEPRTRGIVGVGRPVRGIEVRVADPAGSLPLGDGRVGEVQVRGASVTRGYLSDDPDLVQPFTSDGWLRTGDLGYARSGELYLTGRIKEMIVVRGVNFYPEDIEAAVRGVPGVYKRRCVAFATGTESMALVVETKLDEPADRTRLTTEILAQVATATGLRELDVHLMPPRSIPRTTSGKLQRLATRELI